jgi:hypothetical protein
MSEKESQIEVVLNRENLKFFKGKRFSCGSNILINGDLATITEFAGPINVKKGGRFVKLLLTGEKDNYELNYEMSKNSFEGKILKKPHNLHNLPNYNKNYNKNAELIGRIEYNEN